MVQLALSAVLASMVVIPEPRLVRIPPEIKPILADLESPDVERQKAALAKLFPVHNPPRAVAAWVKPLLQSADDEVQFRAALVLAGVAPDTPGLVQTLRAALRHNDPSRRGGAVDGLTRLGPRAEPAINDLVSTLGDRDSMIGGYAGWALGAIGKAALPNLISQLEHPDWRVRRNAINGIKYMGPDAKEALPDLIERLERDQNGHVRKEAAFAIGRVAPGDERALDALVRALQDKRQNHEEMRSALSQGLSSYGPRIIPILLDVAENGQPNGKTLVDAIVLIGPEAVPELSKHLYRPSGVAYVPLSRLGRPAVPAVMRALRGDDSEARLRAVRTVGWIGPPAREAIPVLLSMADSPNLELSQAAIWSLGRIAGRDDLDVIAVLEEVYPRQSDHHSRKNVREALSEIERRAL